MNAISPNPRDMFLAAIQLPPDQWEAYIQTSCGENAALKQRLLELLAAHRDAGSILASPEGAQPRTVLQEASGEGPGQQIGPYKLLEQIGEGGFGVVYMAEQFEPVRRRVALKVLKPGMDSWQVVARFEAERQALALMDHPNIATVFDGGTTLAGRPYFVMELVKGCPITEYCDSSRLSPRERLELFVTVCQAVQHAHQKGIIHRDLKPSNVLVAVHDTVPVVKVIDFGVAKALGRELTDKTLFTGFAQMIGTPLYMSPEQAGQSALDVDTRSDVYSLGVLLYELLTGTTPFSKERLNHAAWDEIRRIIREEEPPRPSTRLSELSRTAASGGSNGKRGHNGAPRNESTTSLASVSAVRSTEPQRLSRLVQGELDWIVMKALEKDRTRRYGTAVGLASDIQRFLHDEPVEACPPSAAYRLRKFVRRNKGGLSAAGFVALALLVGTAVSIWQAVRAIRAEGLAQTRLDAETKARSDADIARNEAEAGREREKDLKEEAVQQKQRAEANFDKARRAVDEYLTQVTDNQLLSVPGLQPLRENLLSAALKFYLEFTQERADDPTLQRELASAHFRLGRIHQELGQAESAARSNAEAIRLYEQLQGAGHFDQDAHVALAKAYYYSARYEDTIKLCQNVLLTEPAHAELRSLLADTYNALALDAKNKTNNIDAALGYHRQAFELRQSLVRDFGQNSTYLAQLGGTLNNLGVLLKTQGKSEEAAVMYERGVEYAAQAYEKAPHLILWGRFLCIGLRNLALAQSALGRQRDALTSYQRLVTVSRKLAFENPAVTSLRGELASAHLALGRYQRQLGNTVDAPRSLRAARDVLEQIPRETAEQLYELATVYAELAQPVEVDSPLNPDDVAERQRDADLAVQTLQKAVEAGYINAAALKANRQFDALRERTDFQTLSSTIDKAALAWQLAGSRDGTPVDQLGNRTKAATLLSEVVNRQPGSLTHRSTLAATHHSIGVIQIGLRQFDQAEQSFQRALELRDAILKERQGKPEFEVDWIGARVALGSLRWTTGRFPEAHRIWVECSRTLLEIANANRDNAALQKRISSLERTIADGYGSYGLWRLSREFAMRNSHFRRISRDARDAEYAALLLTVDEPTDVSEYLALLGEQLKGAEADQFWGVNHLVRVAAFSHSSALSAEDLVARTRQALAAQKEAKAWFEALLAISLYRAGEFQEAHDILCSRDVVRQLEDSHFAQTHPFSFREIPYLNAVVAATAGDSFKAQSSFLRAEALYREVGEESVTRPVGDSTGLPQAHWHELVFLQALRREAWLRVKRVPAPDDPWQHLIEARGYRLIGETEQVDRELAAAATAAPDDPQVWLARARLLTLWNDPSRPADEAWQRSVELAGEDPRAWIHRGRWHAERGLRELADADYAKAASLAPAELNRFLEAGWWVAGPYPQDLKEFCPPELDPDPSTPVSIVDSVAGLSVEPVKWRLCQVGRLGRVDLQTLPVRQGDGSVYALAHVFSPLEETRLLITNRSHPLRVWINGALVADHAPGEYPAEPYYHLVHRIPIALRAGTNVVLVKARPPKFTVRISDAPLERVVLLAEQDRFAEAFAARAAMAGADRRDLSSFPSNVQGLVALLGSDEDYAELCRSALPTQELGTAYLCALRPNAAFDEHSAALATLIDDLTSRNQSDWSLSYGALVQYRAGNHERAQALLNQSNWKSIGLPLEALVLHQKGDGAQAQSALKRTLEVAEENVNSWENHDRVSFHGKNQVTWWYDWVYFLTLLREAEQAIRGETARFDALCARCEAIARKKWNESPETAVFDHAILYGSLKDSATRFPQPFLSRARRLAALGRFDRAEADLKLAAALKPDDPQIWAAQGAILAERGDLERAAEAFLAGRRAGKSEASAGPVVDDELARHDDIVDLLLERQPQDVDMNGIRGNTLARQARWEEARRVYAYSQPFWRHEACIAALSLLLGDESSFDAACRRQADLLAQPGASHLREGDWRQVQTRGLRPMNAADAAELVEALELDSSAPRSVESWFAMGLAQYRSEQFEEAIVSLGKSRDPQANWQHSAPVWPLLAMAHWRLGRHDEARVWLARSEKWMQMTHRAADLSRSMHDVSTSAWLTAHVLYLEARTLIDGAASADDVRQSLARRAEVHRRAEAARKAMRPVGVRTTAGRPEERNAASEANRHEELGRVLHQNGDFPAAEIEFREVVRLTPARASGYFDLSNALREQKKFEEALTVLQKAAPLDPPREKLEDAVGWLLVSLQRTAEAEAAFRAAIEVDPRHVSASLGLARALELQSRPADAVDAAQEVLKLDPQHAWAREMRAWNLRAAGRFQEAETEFREVIRRHPGIAGAHAGLGMVLRDQGHFDRAIETLATAVRIEPENVSWRGEIGWALLGLGKKREAEEAFRDLVQRHPDVAQSHCFLAMFLLDQKRPAEAEIAAREALRVSPEAAWARQLLEAGRVAQLMEEARPFAERRDWKGAAAALGADFESAPSDNGMHWFSIALARVLSHDQTGYEKLALAMPEKFDGPGPPGQYALLDVCRTCSLRPAGATDPQSLLKRSRRLREFERNNWNVFLLGLAHYRAGEYEKALEHIEEARRFGDWPLFWPALAMTHYRLGQIDAARERLKNADDHFQRITGTAADGVSATGEPYWQDWAYFEAMLLEAQETVQE